MTKIEVSNMICCVLSRNIILHVNKNGGLKQEHYKSPFSAAKNIASLLQWLRTIKSQNPLILRSFKITWQTNNIISPLLECLWPPNWTESQVTLMGSSPCSHLDHMVRNKLKLLYLPYQSLYGHQTW